jgi:hypothetical protein
VSSEQIKIGTKSIALTKAVSGSNFRMKTVLTLDPFDYVDLWLRRENKEEAQHYWRQARNFHRAAQGLPIESSPLVLYYCFMNAAKALLASKSIAFNPYHGVAGNRMRGPNSKTVLSNEGIKIKQNGIVPAMASYFAETEIARAHSRTYCTTSCACIVPAV